MTNNFIVGVICVIGNVTNTVIVGYEGGDVLLVA